MSVYIWDPELLIWFFKLPDFSELNDQGSHLQCTMCISVLCLANSLHKIRSDVFVL